MTDFEKAIVSELRKTRKALQTIASSQQGGYKKVSGLADSESGKPLKLTSKGTYIASSSGMNN